MEKWPLMKKPEKRNKKRKSPGVSLVETMAGFLILIPIGLAAIDLVTLISTSQINDQWANNAAKAASRAVNAYQASEIAEKVLEQFEVSGTIENIQVVDVAFDLGTGQVIVATEMTVKVPVPIPFLPEIVTLRAESIQPIVSTPGPR